MLSKWVGGGGGAYYNAVWEAVTNAGVYSHFRRHPDYNTILEHVTKEEGDRYLACINDHNLLEICLSSVGADLVGNPVTFNYRGAQISPTTVRYAKVAQDMASFFPGFYDFETMAEIGVGYGGQVRIISELNKRLSGKLREFTLIDMLPVVLLAQSYLDNFSILPKCEYVTKSQLLNSRSWDFCYSNYAFAEFDRDLQDEYFTKVISRSFNGYLTMNTGVPGKTEWNVNAMTIKELLMKLPNAVIVRDEPVTVSTNYIVVFGSHDLGEGLSLDEFLASA